MASKAMDAQEGKGYASSEIQLHHNYFTLDASSAPSVGSSALWKRRRKHGVVTTEKYQKQGLQTCEIPPEADVAKISSAWTHENTFHLNDNGLQEHSSTKQPPTIVVSHNRNITRTLSLPERSPKLKVLNSKSSPLASSSELNRSPQEQKEERSQGEYILNPTKGAFPSATPPVKRSPLVSNFFTWDIGERETLHSLPVSKEFGVQSCQNLGEDSIPDSSRSNWRKSGAGFDESAVTDSTLWPRKPPHRLPPLDPRVFEEKSPKAGCTTKKKNSRSTFHSSGTHGHERQKIKTESTMTDTEDAGYCEANTLVSSEGKLNFQVKTSPVAVSMPVSRPATDFLARSAQPRCDGTSSTRRKQSRSQSFNSRRGVECGQERYLSQFSTPVPHSTPAPPGASSSSHDAFRRHRKAVCEGAESFQGNKERIKARVLMKKFGALTLSEKNYLQPPTNSSI